MLAKTTSAIPPPLSMRQILLKTEVGEAAEQVHAGKMTKAAYEEVLKTAGLSEDQVVVAMRYTRWTVINAEAARRRAQLRGGT